MKRYTMLSSALVLNENISINIRSRISSVGGRHTIQAAYDYVYKPLLLKLHRFGGLVLQWCAYCTELAKRPLGSLFWMDCERPDETAFVVHFHSQKSCNYLSYKKINQDVTPVRIVFATITHGMVCDLRQVNPWHGIWSQSQAILYYHAADLAQRNIDKPLTTFFYPE
ncbi:hypothetical protein ACJMK2_036932 [Sinanodonta woodiana]|uniref:Uncharacterized protein n=1 Tax=Sinanodonta woodiana TaxID=1069815 RepID=A0ABD3WM64_SINWO